MDRICFRRARRAGRKSVGRLEFKGRKISVFRAPCGGRERVGSMGTDFTLYSTPSGKFILVMERWSRRPGGENSTVYEIYDSVTQMVYIPVRDEYYDTEVPPELIRSAEIPPGLNRESPGSSVTGFAETEVNGDENY